MIKSWRNYVKTLELSGEKWLKITGVILLLGACLSAISLFSNAAQIGRLLDGETQAVKRQYDWVWTILGVSFGAVAIRFLAGLAGISYCRNTKKAKTCIRFGIAMLIVWIAGLVITVIFDTFSLSSLLGFIIPLAYLVGATKNDEENGELEVEKSFRESVSEFIKSTCEMAKRNSTRCIVIGCIVLITVAMVVATSITRKNDEKDSLIHGKYLESNQTYEAVDQYWSETFKVELVANTSKDEWLFSFSEEGINIGEIIFHPEETHTLSGDYEVVIKDKGDPEADDSCTLSFTKCWYEYKDKNWHEKTILEITTNNPNLTAKKLTDAGLDINKIKSE